MVYLMKFNLCLFSPLLEDGLFLRYTVAKIIDITNKCYSRRNQDEWIEAINLAVGTVVVLALFVFFGGLSWLG